MQTLTIEISDQAASELEAERQRSGRTPSEVVDDMLLKGLTHPQSKVIHNKGLLDALEELSRQVSPDREPYQWRREDAYEDPRFD